MSSQTYPPNPPASQDLLRRPWICRQDYAAANPQQLSISVHDNSHGEILGWSSSGWVQVALWGTHPVKHGMVPYDNIVVGSGRCSQPVRVIDHGVLDSATVAATNNYSHEGFPGATTFEKAVSALLIGIAENMDKTGLTNVNSAVRSAFTKGPKQLKVIAQKIVAGTKAAGQYQGLSLPDFSARDILLAPTRKDLTTLPGTPDHAGVYMIVYENQDGQRLGYIGKSTRIVNRYKEHRYHRNHENDVNYNNYHYRTSREYNKAVYAVALCIMNASDEGDGTLRIAEQIFVSLLETYRSTLVNFKPSGGDEAVAWLSDYEHCKALTVIAEKAKHRSGWPGAIVSRTTRFDVHDALNWNSPICEYQYEKSLWVRSTSEFSVPDDPQQTTDVALYRLTVPRLCNMKQRKIWTIGKGTKYPGFQLYFPVDAKIPKVKDMSNVHIFAEIRLDGKAHPQCYARLPDFGCWQDWERANSIALGCEYEDEQGQWYRMYIPNSKYYPHQAISDALWREGDNQGVNTSYAEATALIRFFNNEPWYKDDMRPFDFEWGAARVKEMKLDHLRQIIEFTEMPTKDIHPQNRKLGWDVITHGMKARSDLRLQCIDGPWQTFAPGSADILRKKCDACALSSSLPSCKQMESKDASGNPTVAPTERHCSTCYVVRGVPCSWTGGLKGKGNSRTDAEISLYGLRIKALVERPLQLVVIPIDPPALSRMTVEHAADPVD